MDNTKVWYITGASRGLGFTLVKQLLSSGYRVAATSRSVTELQRSVRSYDPLYFLPLEVDLTNTDAIHNSIDQTIAAFSKVDVIVNNAGYGMEGTVEELNEKDMHAIFAINVFASISVIKWALPYMRKQHSGHIINISSVAGFVGAPGWSVYSATKSALIAFSEVLALDLHDLGIKVTVVGPSGFRTGFLSQESLVTTESRITDYQAVSKTRARYAAMNGNQDGDPEKAAAVFIQLAENPEPPLHLWLGVNAVERASEKIESMARELNKWKTLSVSAEYHSDS